MSLSLPRLDRCPCRSAGANEIIQDHHADLVAGVEGHDVVESWQLAASCQLFCCCRGCRCGSSSLRPGGFVRSSVVSLRFRRGGVVAWIELPTLRKSWQLYPRIPHALFEVVVDDEVKLFCQQEDPQRVQKCNDVVHGPCRPLHTPLPTPSLAPRGGLGNTETWDAFRRCVMGDVAPGISSSRPCPQLSRPVAVRCRSQRNALGRNSAPGSESRLSPGLER